MDATDLPSRSKPPLLKELRAGDATAQLIDSLKKKIKRGVYQPGQRLVESDIMRETGASRARVREAFQRMEAEGYLVIEPFRGASVRKLTRPQVEQMGRVRETLEGLAARLAAEASQSPGDRATLREIQDALDAAKADRRIESYLEANERYHSFIIETARNDYVAAFLERVRLPIFPLQFRSLLVSEKMFEHNADHREITGAILAGDGETAEAAMRAHIRHGNSELAVLDDDYYA